jgi:hypothetical protein
MSKTTDRILIMQINSLLKRYGKNLTLKQLCAEEEHVAAAKDAAARAETESRCPEGEYDYNAMFKTKKHYE